MHRWVDLNGLLFSIRAVNTTINSRLTVALHAIIININDFLSLSELDLLGSSQIR